MDQRKQLEQQLIEKAMKDETFRKRLIENPGAAIAAETGWKIPETGKSKYWRRTHKQFIWYYLML